MPRMNPEQFGKRPRWDGKPGFQEVSATVQRFEEADQTDVRVVRVRLYTEAGVCERIYLQDTMGAKFKDEPHIADDPSFPLSLTQK